MAVRRPQIWRDECIAVGFIQLLYMASLRTLLTKIAVYDKLYTPRSIKLPVKHTLTLLPSCLIIHSFIVIL